MSRHTDIYYKTHRKKWATKHILIIKCVLIILTNLLETKIVHSAIIVDSSKIQNARKINGTHNNIGNITQTPTTATDDVLINDHDHAFELTQTYNVQRQELVQNYCDKYYGQQRNALLDDIPDDQLDHLLIDRQHKFLYCYVPKVSFFVFEFP